MVDPIFQSSNYQLSRTLLDASVLRHSAIAANIANAETPGYRRLDLAPDFASELRARVTAGAGPADLRGRCGRTATRWRSRRSCSR
jgi:flagellar basal-body rod protein FlgB